MDLYNIIVDLILVLIYGILHRSPSSDCLVQLKWPSMSTRFTILSLKFFHDLATTSETQ